VLVVGQTGSGKSTSLAAMIGHRNQHGNGHIVTIEDPIEFVHQHQNCIISQRDVGIDTYSYGMALKNALRQTPDVILIGEIRDRETMEHAISFAETGHLCVSTLHANNANGAIERILNFFPIEAHRQILINLSFNLRGIISQRLVEKKTSSKEKNRSGRVPAVEVLLNEGIIRDYLYRGEIGKIKEIMEKNVDAGMQTFDQALIKLYHTGLITMEAAIAEADSPSNVRMEINQQTMQAKFSVEPNFSTQHRNDF
jgi:twitching motility protein PilU